MWHNTTGKRWFLTADGRAVEESDPAAGTLIVGIDGEIPLMVAQGYGLAAPAKVPPAAPDDLDTKAVPPPPNKAKAPPANKSGTG